MKDKLEDDPDGKLTLQYLNSVRKRIERITGDTPASLGVHPVVYFYTRGGAFQPTALLATSLFLEDLAEKGNLKRFTDVRKDFEEFLIRHKEAISLFTHKFGSGDRSLPWIYDYYKKVVEGLWAGKSLHDIQNDFANNPDFAFLTVPRPSGVRPQSTKQKHPFSAGTKTAAFFAAALPAGTRCRICGALVHKNSIQFDHKVPMRDGGPSDASNAQVAHPYCNSTVKG